MEEGHGLVGGWETDHRDQSRSRKTSRKAIPKALVSKVLVRFGLVDCGQGWWREVVGFGLCVEDKANRIC